MRCNTIRPDCTDDYIRVLSDLISIPSIKSDPKPGAPYGIHTSEALNYMLSICEQNGLWVKNMDNRVGYAQWGSGKKMIAVVCHLDIVPPGEGWENDPFTLTRKNGLLMGRGVTDNKGPAVSSLFSLLRLRESGYQPTCRIRLIFGLDEEHGCSCMDHYVANEELPEAGFTPDASFPAIFAEKGLLQIRLRGPGSSLLEAVGGDAYNVVPSSCSIKNTATSLQFSAVGTPAHASTPEKGENAIYKAISLIPNDFADEIPALSFIRRNLMAEIGNDPLVGCAPADISGSLTINNGILRINKEESIVGLDIRYPVLSDGDSVCGEVFRKASVFGLEAEIIHHLPPLYTDPNHDYLRALRKAYEHHLPEVYSADHPFEKSIPLPYQSCDPIAIGGGTYARSIPGIVAFGPVFPWEESKMHQKTESCSEAATIASIDLYSEAIRNLCLSLER